MEYNYIMVCSAAGWILAQAIKIVIEICKTKTFSPDRIYGPGGMPSSHSAMVTAAAVASVRLLGIGDPLTAVVILLAMVVMYDAMGVRREAGNHAHQLNIIKNIIQVSTTWDKLNDEEKKQFQDKQFKEILGHTPLQVLAGVILGVILAFVIPVSID